MNRVLGMICLIPLFLGIIISCSIKPPEVRVTGEKTALEQEVMGTYKRMETDTWMVASVRSSNKKGGVKISEEKKAVLDAMQSQKFNKDDIDDFKQKGLVGENNLGFLEIRNPDQLSNDAEQEELVVSIVEEENENRRTILNRVVELNTNLQNTVLESIMTVFAEMYQENSPAGAWIQTLVGEWIQK